MVELEAPFICEDGGGGTAAGCTNKQHQRRNMGPTEAQLGGDKYVPDTEEVYWQRDPADLPELYQKELSGAARASIPELYQKELSGAAKSHGMEKDSIPPHDRIDIGRAQRSFDKTET